MEQTVRHFQEELEALKSRLLEMGGLAEERTRARKVYTESVLPMLKPMLKDFGMDPAGLIRMILSTIFLFLSVNSTPIWPPREEPIK